MLINATRRWQPRFLRYSLTGDRFYCALENYSFGKVQDSRDVRCVRLEIFVADQSSGLSELVEGLYPTPHIYEQMTAQIMATDNMNLEHNTMINIDTAAHMILHNTQS